MGKSCRSMEEFGWECLEFHLHMCVFYAYNQYTFLILILDFKKDQQNSFQT